MGANADDAPIGSLTLDLVGEEVDPAIRALNPSERTSICLQFAGGEMQSRSSFCLGLKRRLCMESWSLERPTGWEDEWVGRLG